MIKAGDRFGILTVIEKDLEKSVINVRKNYYICKCDCGRIKSIVDYSLKNTKSCGCQNSTKTHGMFGTKFYAIYAAIKSRCDYKKNKRYKDYGGRGISYEWRRFEDFKEDMYDSYLEHIEKYGEHNTTIERINVDENYNKNNCRWATYTEQANNKRTNVFYDYAGESHTLAEWCRIKDLPYKQVHHRVKRLKWDIEKALETPIRRMKRKAAN